MYIFISYGQVSADAFLDFSLSLDGISGIYCFRKKEKKQKKQDKLQENAPTPRSEEKLTDKSGSVSKKQEKREAKSLQVRTFPNGLVIEELAMGKPDGKKASPGKKVNGLRTSIGPFSFIRTTRHLKYVPCTCCFTWHS